MKVIELIYVTLNLIHIARMKCNIISSINKEAPITCKMRIIQPLFMFIVMYSSESKAIVKKQL